MLDKTSRGVRKPRKRQRVVLMIDHAVFRLDKCHWVAIDPVGLHPPRRAKKCFVAPHQCLARDHNPPRNSRSQQSVTRHRPRDYNTPTATEFPTSRANIQRLNRRITRLKKDVVNVTKRGQRLREKLAKKSEEATTLTPASQPGTGNL